MRTQILLLVSCLSVAGASADQDSRGRLEREVRHELVMLPFYGVFDNFGFQVDGDDVTLAGQVTRPSLKAEAERAVKQIEGVGNVSNRIEVLPLSPNDDRIRLDAYRAIYGNPALYRYALMAVPSIHIVVRNGAVTLEGVVDRRADKDVATIQTNAVSGVFSVINNLRVDGGTER